MADGMLSLSWNNHRATFCHILATLREKERYTDVTVACEGKFYPVHKLVLSTCSEYFEKIFENTPCKHPVIVLKDVNRSDLEALFCYMYEGAVSVAQSNLGRLIKAAEVLRIKGLAVPDEPPISDSGGRRGSSHHHSTDDRSSPHPKRRRREENNSHTHQRTRSSPTPPSSPRPSPLESGDSHPALRSRSDSQWDQTSNDRDDVGVDGHDDRLGEQSIASHAVPTPPQVEVMMDETLVKEEMIDQGDTGQDDLLDSGMDYASVGSDSRLDGSATGGGGEEDHLLPGKYEPKSNPTQQAIPEAVVEALAGPSGMQTWLGGSEMPSGFSGLEGYGGGEGGQDLHAPTQAPAAHQLMERKGKTDGRKAAGEWQGPNSSSSGHKCPHCDYATASMNEVWKHIALSHSGAKPYFCPYCLYRTTRNSLLKEHINTHTGERPFACPHCPYSSSHRNILKRHIRTHTGEKPYVCTHCPFQAASKTNLNKHLLIHKRKEDMNQTF